MTDVLCISDALDVYTFLRALPHLLKQGAAHSLNLGPRCLNLSTLLKKTQHPAYKFCLKLSFCLSLEDIEK
jgi:hypothetical protein